MKAKALSAVATVLLLAVMAVALPFSVPKLFGYQIYNVLTQSMEPAMPVGSAIYVKRCDPQALKVVMCIPVLGTVSEMLHSGPGVTACVAIFALAIILWTLADKTKKRERSK